MPTHEHSFSGEDTTSCVELCQTVAEEKLLQSLFQSLYIADKAYVLRLYPGALFSLTMPNVDLVWHGRRSYAHFSFKNYLTEGK